MNIARLLVTNEDTGVTSPITIRYTGDFNCMINMQQFVSPLLPAGTFYNATTIGGSFVTTSEI